MYFDRYRCAHAGALLVAGAILISAPVPAQAASSFQKGVQHAIHEVVDLIAQDAGQSGTRSEIRHLEKALNQLLDVLEHQRKHHRKHGHMHKGATAHQKQANKGGGSKVGTSAGKKAETGTPTSAKKAIGGSTGKNANKGKGSQPVCNVKKDGGPASSPSKKSGGNTGAARKPANQPSAGNAKGCPNKNVSSALAKNGAAKTGNLGNAVIVNKKVGCKPGGPKVNQGANTKNATAPQKTAVAQKTAPVSNPKVINDKTGGIAGKNANVAKKTTAAKQAPFSQQFTRSPLASRNGTTALRAPRSSIGSTVGLRNLQPVSRRK